MTPWFACAACYGQSDSTMAAGMNWGIFSLLVVIVSVLGGVAGFFIFLARRAATVNGPVKSDSEMASLPAHSASENRLRPVPGLNTALAGRALPSVSTKPAPHGCSARQKTGSRFSL